MNCALKLRWSPSLALFALAFAAAGCAGEIGDVQDTGAEAVADGAAAEGTQGDTAPDAGPVDGEDDSPPLQDVLLEVGAEVAPGDTVTDDAPADASIADTPKDTGIVVPQGWDPYCTKELFSDFPPELSDPNCLDGEALFQCDAAEDTTSTPARIRRIGRDEMVRASGFKLHDDLGQNPFEPPSHLPYTTYEKGVTVDPVTLDLYLNVLHLPGKGWTNQFAPRMSYTYIYGGGGGSMVDACIFDDADPDQACRDQWARQFLEGGVLFRPATDEELGFVMEQLDLALDKEATTGASRSETLSFVTAAMWLSPEALFRDEFGEDTADEQGRHRLTDAELGKAVAYLLTDRGPGAPATHTSTGGYHVGWSNAAEGDRTPYLTDVQAAVADGSIQQPEVLEQLLRNHFGDNDPDRPDLHVEVNVSKTTRRGAYYVSTKVRDFFRQWLDYGSVSSDFKDTPHATSRFTREDYDTSLWKYLDDAKVVAGSYGGLLTTGGGDNETTLLQQMDDFVARILVEDVDVFKSLLTSRLYRLSSTRPGAACVEDSECGSKCLNGRCYGSTWVDHRFAGLPYDIPGHIEGNVDPTNDPRWVTMPSEDRAGVLTHPAWLASHGDNFEDGQSAIHRGRWIREKLFCQHVPPLSKVPPGVEIMLPASHPDLSARERITIATDNSFCGSCHVRMNSLGLAFEAYNHAGFVRGWDRSLDPEVAQGPVDSTTTLEPAGSDGALPDPALQGMEFDHPVAMVTAFSNSSNAKRCFIRQSFRYFVGRDEAMADACTLKRMEDAFDTKGSFIDMLVALVQSGTFRYRTRPDSLTCAE